MRAPWLAAALRGAGLKVVEQPGWQGRRPGYELTAIEGVVVHHTASPQRSTLATNLAVVTNGNGVAPGPIANLLLWRDGTWYCITDGKANHAGAGGPWGWLPASPAGTLSVANARTVGIEAVNDGVGEPWAAEMVLSYEIGVATILAWIGHGADRVLTHHEWAPSRKIDPAGPTGGRIATLPGTRTWSGDAFRARVAGWLTPPAPTPPAPVPPAPPLTEDEDMPRPLIIVGNEDNKHDPRRWAWDPGRSLTYLQENDPTLITIVTTDANGKSDAFDSRWSLADPLWRPLSWIRTFDLPIA